MRRHHTIGITGVALIGAAVAAAVFSITIQTACEPTLRTFFSAEVGHLTFKGTPSWRSCFERIGLVNQIDPRLLRSDHGSPMRGDHDKVLIFK
jgi:hypothetical protein